MSATANYHRDLLATNRCNRLRHIKPRAALFCNDCRQWASGEVLVRFGPIASLRGGSSGEAT